MIDQQALASHVFVPGLRIAEFQQVIFAFHIGRDAVGYASLRDRRHGHVTHRQQFGFGYAQHLPFKGIVEGWRVASVVHIASVHKRGPVPYAVALAVIAAVGVVEVGEAHRMAVFVAESAYGGHQIVILEVLGRALRAAGVAVDHFAVQAQVFSGPVPDVPGVGPDAIVAGILGCIPSGEEYEHVVHFAVAVIVVE